MKKLILKKSAGKKPPPTPQELVKRDHFSRIRALFRLAGFTRISKLEDKPFIFEGSECDIDDVFYQENVIVFVEYTVKTENIPTHLKKKSVPFTKIANNPPGFLKYLHGKFPAFSEAMNDLYDYGQYKVIIVYASRYAISSITKAEVPVVKYLDYNVVGYLESVGRTVRLSAKYEILEFLGVSAAEFGEACLAPGSIPTKTYPGSILPESHSNFGDGFKVTSFYVDPEALLQRSYVLRRDGWRAGSSLYQRMISRAKIEEIRRYLRVKKRVFINNLIVTLPSTTQIIDDKGKTVNAASITKTSPARIQIPNEFGCVGIIDGQHRLFAYHEGGVHEGAIAKLRKRQNLLVTGLIFPADMGDEERIRFEANLFLEINSNQTKAKSDLKQEIEVMLHPYSHIAIAKAVLNRINDSNGPLGDEFERYFFDKDKIKTASVVSFALSHLVRIGGPDSLFKEWKHPDKAELQSKDNDALLGEYVGFCASQIEMFLSAIKSHVPDEKWVADRKVANYFLSTVNINGCLRCLRRIVRDSNLSTKMKYTASLEGLESADFKGYKSSQYNSLGDALYDKYFN